MNDEDFKYVTRLEIIDNRPCENCKGERWIKEEGKKPRECWICQGLGFPGRSVIFWDKTKKISISLQDAARTLKIFIDERPMTVLPNPESGNTQQKGLFDE